MPNPQLPSDSDLSKLYVLGRSDSDVAQVYKVTRQAVQRRWAAMGLYQRPIAMQVNEALAEVWDVKTTTGRGSHMESSPCQSLRYYLRRKLGDDLSERQVLTAERFENRLLRKHEVLDYDPAGGFHYTDRQPSDGRLVIRWPAGRPRPVGDREALWSLPERPAGLSQM